MLEDRSQCDTIVCLARADQACHVAYMCTEYGSYRICVRTVRIVQYYCSNESGCGDSRPCSVREYDVRGLSGTHTPESFHFRHSAILVVQPKQPASCRVRREAAVYRDAVAARDGSSRRCALILTREVGCWLSDDGGGRSFVAAYSSLRMGLIIRELGERTGNGRQREPKGTKDSACQVMIAPDVPWIRHRDAGKRRIFCSPF